MGTPPGPDNPPRMRLLQGILPVARSQVPIEIIAGITFAALAIPEVMGYTRIAGMPVVTGLYTILFPMLAFAIVGSSRHLAVGADSATAAIIASGLVVMAIPGSQEYVAYAAMIAIMAAIFLFLAGIMKLGFIADFLSRSVMIGFLTGVGIQIAIGQLSGMTGLPVGYEGAGQQLISFFSNLSMLQLPTLVLSLAVIAVTLAGRRISRRIPGALIAVSGAIIVSWALNLSANGIEVIGPVPGGFPTISFPVVPLSAIPDLLGLAAGCFIVILAQSAATSRSYALKFSDRFDENTDLIGLSLSNIAAGLTGTFVVNGSPTKTEMVVSSRGRTQLTQVVAAIVVLAVLLVLTQPLSYLPIAALSAIVFLIGLRLIDLGGMSSLRSRRPVEFGVALITAGAVIFLGVGIGIAVAVALSIIAHLRHSYRPMDMLMVPLPGGAMKPTSLAQGQQAVEGLAVYRFGADLYFANETRFTEEILNLARNAQPPLKWLCLSAVNISDVDYTASETLKALYKELKRYGVVLVLSDLSELVRAELDRDGITGMIGEDHIFETVQEAVAAYRSRVPELSGE
jgi:SulP family sulfate permease